MCPHASREFSGATEHIFWPDTLPDNTNCTTEILKYFFKKVWQIIVKKQIQNCFGYLCAKNHQNIFTVAKIRWHSLSHKLLTVPHCRTMLGRRRFSVAAPRVWKSLPLGLKTNCDSLRGFKLRGLITYLFCQDYN